MLLQILILGITTAVQATYLHGGKSFSSRKDDGYGNYIFSYDIEDPHGATNGRYEIGDANGNKKGGYSITDIDGRVRRVEYVADEHGFRAVVHTNEPGTAASHPASALISSPYGVNKHPPVHDVPVTTIKRVVRPVAIDPIAQTVHDVPVGSVKNVVRPVVFDHVPQTIHDVPIGSIRKAIRPIVADHVSQTVVHDVPFGSVRKVPPVAIDHVSQTVHDVPVPLKEIRRPVTIAQTVHHPQEIIPQTVHHPQEIITQTVHHPQEIITQTHQVTPIIARAKTFRSAQNAHAAAFRPNLYNGEYAVKYRQPYPPIVQRIHPGKVHRAPSIYALQLNPAVTGVASSALPIHDSTTGHFKGTPFNNNGLYRNLYENSLQKPHVFRSHLL